MVKLSSMSRGAETKEMILKAALDFTSRWGLESLSIGELAKKVGMSKSGLFGHFNSKEKLQTMVLDYASTNFVNEVLLPAFKSPRGIPRIEATVENWYAWMDKQHTGGCPFAAAAFEYDDRPGAVQDHLRKYLDEMINSFVRSAEIAVEVGHFKKDTDCKEFAFRFYSYLLGLHLYDRLLKEDQALELHKKAFHDLMSNYLV
ncbi:MAG: TetR/AcrR family transcriptional regulator [Bacteriovoracaceae bacterium]|nr:TetR/AcrR family transcriptional regulator [Bacteriovoracaceae bacterium]